MALALSIFEHIADREMMTYVLGRANMIAAQILGTAIRAIKKHEAADHISFYALEQCTTA
jgi:hypothetical protein